MSRQNPATGLAGLALQALGAAGVGHVVLCPGSRSAPLAYELARQGSAGPQLHVRHDERVAAFTALGVGLTGVTIGAVVTTSGTAAANLHPAVLEAHHANRPLVVVTADRPPGLRGTWANQTSDLQAAVFGEALRARVDLDDVTAAADRVAAYRVLRTAVEAAAGGAGARPGPVHLNLGFSEPLLPDPDDDGSGTLRISVPDAPGTVAGSPRRLAAGPRTVVLAGDGAGPHARRFAEAAGLPLLAEPSSGSRGGPNAIGPYRLLLELPAFGPAIQRVVAFGRPTLSRPVTALVNRPDLDLVLVSPWPGWPQPGRAATRCAAVHLEGATDHGWLARWRSAGSRAAEALDAALDAAATVGRLPGPLLAREVAAALGPDDVLVTSASNAVRDLDLAAAPWTTDPGPQILANRGLAGIDGVLSTATGVALAGDSGRTTRVLIGDLSFLHDLNALLTGPAERRPELQIVLLDDGGGGIFSLLEHGERALLGPGQRADFERVFATPHHAGIGDLCRGYGVAHQRVDDLGSLRAALAVPARGISVLQVTAARDELRELHARLRQAVHAAVG